MFKIEKKKKHGMECFHSNPPCFFFGVNKETKKLRAKIKLSSKEEGKSIFFFLEMVSVVRCVFQAIERTLGGILNTQLPAANQQPNRPVKKKRNQQQPVPPLQPRPPTGFFNTKFIKAFVGHFLSFFVITFSFPP